MEPLLEDSRIPITLEDVPRGANTSLLTARLSDEDGLHPDGEMVLDKGCLSSPVAAMVVSALDLSCQRIRVSMASGELTSSLLFLASSFGSFSL